MLAHCRSGEDFLLSSHGSRSNMHAEVATPSNWKYAFCHIMNLHNVYSLVWNCRFSSHCPSNEQVSLLGGMETWRKNHLELLRALGFWGWQFRSRLEPHSVRGSGFPATRALSGTAAEGRTFRLT